MEMTLSCGESSQAKYVQAEWTKRMAKLYRSTALGHEPLLQDLAELRDECGSPDWDGYNALPVEDGAYHKAARFILALPFGMPKPSLGATPDGSISLVWSTGRRHTLTVSIDRGDDLHYAALIGPGRTCGSEPFFGEVPRVILDLIHRIDAC